MAYEHKPGTFSLFKNDKGDNEKRPDYTGDGMGLDGTPIKVSAWLKDGAKGKFMSCQIKRKDEVAQQGAAKVQQAAKPAAQPSIGKDDFMDDIPFN
jgi:hypothetical protein